MDKIKKEPLASFAHLNSNEFTTPSSRWLCRQIGEVCDIIMGQSPPSSSYNTNGAGLPFYQGNADFGKIYPVTRIYCSSPLKKAKTNDILVSVRAPVGALNIAREQCCIGRGVAAIRANDADYLFLYYAIHQFQKILEKLSSGSTFTAICKQDLTSLKIPLPPLSEQQRIATVLATVDEAIAATEQVIDNLVKTIRCIREELIKSINHYPKEKLCEICSKITKGATPTSYGYSYREMGINFIKIESIDAEGNLIRSKFAHIDEETHSFLSRSILEENDVLFSIAGALGRTAIVSKEYLPANTNQAVAIIRLKMEGIIIPEFLKFILDCDQIQNLINNISVQSAQKNISLEQVRTFNIPLPPLPEQRRIAAILATLDDRLATERNERDRLVTLKKGLMQVLLTGRVRVPPGVAEEVAPAHV